MKTQVSPRLEIAEITDRVLQDARAARAPGARQIPRRTLGGKALLFENVEGSDIPVAINTFGSYWRVNQALGTESSTRWPSRVQQLVKPEMPTTLMEKMKKLPDLMKMARFPPKTVRAASASRSCSKGRRRSERSCRSSSAGRSTGI